MRIFLCILFAWCFDASGQNIPKLTFDFGGNTHIAVNENTVWPTKAENALFGLSGSKNVKTVKAKDESFLTAPEPFYFSIELPEGNYHIHVKLGDPEGISNTTIKAESRRLMVYDHSTKKKEVSELSFIVNVRSARINGSDSIRLKKREFGYLNWDDRLTLEFGGEKPSIISVSIEPVIVPTIFLTGNSTVVDQDKEPWASWGQMFPLFLKSEVSVANYAESGETLKAFIRERRLEKIATQIKPGDYLFMEFAHNDQKPGGNHVEPYTSYQEYLMKFVELARANQATPVFVTSTNRRTFNDQGEIENSLGDYPEAMRQLALEENITLIDLNAMSKILYEALGPELSKKAFVHYPANSFSWQSEALADNTHFSTYGAYELAKCIAESIRTSAPDLKNFLKEDLSIFDPSSPDPPSKWKWPISKMDSASRPEG